MADEEFIPDLAPLRVRAVDPDGPGGRAFWRRVGHDGVARPVADLSVLRDLVPEERARAYAIGPGRVGAWRVWERPSDVEAGLEERVPQMVLRNLFRLEMDAWPDDLWWQRAEVRTTPAEAAALLGAVHAGDVGARPSPLFLALSCDLVAAHKRAHQDLTLRTDWAAFTWRRRRPPETPGEEAG